MISMLMPTRGRPESFKRMCLSVLENAVEPNNIEFVIYRDNDDASVYEYFGNHKEIIGEKINHMQMYNECLKIAAGPIYMSAADDIVFYTKDWDKYVMDAFDNSADKIIFVFANDQYYRSSFGQVYFLHKNWIDTLGYFLPVYFAAQYGDNWMNDISFKINRRVFLRPVVVKHLCDENYTDQTHIEYLKKGRQSNAKAIYRSKEAERAKDAQLLQNFIDNFKQ